MKQHLQPPEPKLPPPCIGIFEPGNEITTLNFYVLTKLWSPLGPHMWTACSLRVLQFGMRSGWLAICVPLRAVAVTCQSLWARLAVHG